MDLRDLTEFAGVGRSVIEMLRSAYELLPKGSERDRIGSAIVKAEDLLARSDAKLATELGYPICQCTFPPQIMLWREQANAWECRNENCGRILEPPPVIDPVALARAFKRRG